MSGGFFRGTSAEQDTRFSNKQAKLLKTQKFAPELEHLVDMTKVKMDVMRPWIANRVTELLGFEDEVLINFIYGLLEGKEVNGKEVQIQLTGFMEKHTVKFMKELWMHLLSAQKNASGVPQQFLDAKEEETRKKKLEADRIANEIQRKQERESREIDQETLRNMDGSVEMKAVNVALDPSSKVLAKDEKEAGERNGVRGRNRVSRSPRSAAHSPSPHRGSPSQSVGKSHSNSRSYSNDRRKSRSVSRSPKARRRSNSPRRRSITPPRRHSPRISWSPSRRSSYFRRRSRSHSPRRTPSPVRRRRSPSLVRRRRSPSPVRRRRSPSPVRRRRSPSPVRHRRSPSPVQRRRSPSPFRHRRSPSLMRRRRSPSPVRRRRSPSPGRYRSPSPVWRRRSPLPMRHASPVATRRRSPSNTRHWSPSPVRHRSPSPVRQRYERSPLTPQRRSPSLVGNRSLMPSRMRSPVPSQRRSPSPYELSSPSPRRNSPLVVRRRSPVHSPKAKNRSLRSPRRGPEAWKDLRKNDLAFSPSPERLPSISESPPHVARKRSVSQDRRSFSPQESPVRIRDQMVHDGSTTLSPRRRGQRPRQDGSETSEEDRKPNCVSENVDDKSVPLHGRSIRSSTVSKHEDVPVQVCNEEEHSPRSDKMPGRGVRTGTSDQRRLPTVYEDSLSIERQRSTYPGESQNTDGQNRTHKNNGKDNDRHRKSENATMEIEKADRNNRSGTFDSGSEERGKHRAKGKEKRKHKKYDREEVASDDEYSSDSEMEKKEAKRRRKEEKKLRREEKRRRRDERRRRREERRAEKLKMKIQSDTDASDVPRRESHPSDDEDTESAQKKLEMELRKKALESIKAKKNSSR